MFLIGLPGTTLKGFKGQVDPLAGLKAQPIQRSAHKLDGELHPPIAWISLQLGLGPVRRLNGHPVRSVHASAGSY